MFIVQLVLLKNKTCLFYESLLLFSSFVIFMLIILRTISFNNDLFILINLFAYKHGLQIKYVLNRDEELVVIGVLSCN